MTLSNLVPSLFRKIRKPEHLNQIVSDEMAGSSALTGKNVPDSPDLKWEDDLRPGFAGSFEGNSKYDNSFRIGSAWRTPPYVNKGTLHIGNNESTVQIKGLFPWGQVGTNNNNLPAALGTYLQEIRRGEFSPENDHDQSYLQNMSASLITLFTPVLLGKIILDKFGAEPLLDDRTEIGFRENQTKNMKMPISLEEALGTYTIYGFSSSHVSSVSTVSGVLSQARVLDGLAGYTPELIVRNKIDLPGFKITFVDIQRAGVLTSLFASAISDMYGLKNSIISTDVKRENKDPGHHDTEVVGARLETPTGYRPSVHSTFQEGIVFPSDYKEGEKNAFVLYDPMLATGVSTLKMIDVLINKFHCSPKDIYVVSLFAGGYGSLERLDERRVNVLVLAHDQADLTGNGYIVPGLGDFGDRIWQEKKEGRGIVNNSSLEQLYKNISKTRFRDMNEHIYKTMNAYSLQLCGERLS